MFPNCDDAATTRFCSLKISTFLAEAPACLDFVSENAGFGSMLAKK